MRQRIALSALLWAALLAAACAFTPVDALEATLRGLQGRDGWSVSVSQAGTSSVRHLPLWEVHLTPPHPLARVLILARVHGDEPAATEAALTFMRSVLSDERPAYRKFEYVVLPCLNPEGASRNRRENDEGLDINRDYLRLSTAEARAVVSLYDSFHPALVVDMHEFDDQDWRSRYWDFLIGAGRAPWAAPSLNAWCRSMTETVLFPALAQGGVRAQHYVLPSGTFDSSMHYASNAADYFLVRGTPAFLFESAGGDTGESTAHTRVHAHCLALETLLEHVDPQDVERISIQAAAEEAIKRDVALTVTPKPSTVPGPVPLEGLDYEVAKSVPLPPAFFIQSHDADYLRRLTLHGIPLTTMARAFTVGPVAYPAGTVVARANTPLAGLLLLDQMQSLTVNHLPMAGRVTAAPAGFQVPETTGSAAGNGE